MPGRFGNELLFKYPRMSSEDTRIWEKFLVEHGKQFDRFDYDLKIGEGVTPSLNIPEIYIKDFQELTKKRIDAVGYKNSSAHIFEVKPRAGTQALGQLITYKFLFVKTFPTVPLINLNLVCEIITQEELILYTQNNIIVYSYPPEQQ